MQALLARSWQLVLHIEARHVPITRSLHVQAIHAYQTLADTKLKGINTGEAKLLAEATKMGLDSYEMVLLEGKREMRRWLIKPEMGTGGNILKEYLDSVLQSQLMVCCT